jgi:hypothetical protein
MPWRERFYRWRWHLANRIRRRFRYPAQPKRCCRETANLGPVEQDGPGLTYRRCQLCGCRHFELTADPGRFGLRGLHT